MQKLKELICLLFGHKWSTDFKPNDELSKPIQVKTFKHYQNEKDCNYCS